MYHVKLLLKYTVKEQIFYEESILQVDAGSFDEAYQKAEIYVKQTMDNKRRNMYGDTVSETKLVELLSDSCTREEMLPLRYFPDPK